jgi:hypothetical protein
MHSSVPVRIRPAIPATATAAVLALISVVVPILPPTSVSATGTLANESVSPGSGTTSMTFVFSVEYASSPDHEPTDIWVDVGGTVIPLQFSGVGTPEDGTYQESSQLPPGTHTVTFHATGPGQDPALDAGTVTVTAGPTPPPTPVPTPGPTPPPTPVPTAHPQPTPTATPLPPGVTPRPTPRPTPLPPGVTPNPATPTPEGSPDETDPESPAASGPSASADGSARPSDAVSSGSPAAATGSPAASADPNQAGQSGGMGRLGWIVLGGMTSVAGAFVLGRQWWIKRRA